MLHLIIDNKVDYYLDKVSIYCNLKLNRAQTPDTDFVRYYVWAFLFLGDF